MKRTPARLTPALQQQLCAYLRAGAYPHVAAEACGVPREVFDDWLRRGTARPAREPYRSFAAETRQAMAQARAGAEVQTLQKSPVTWLKNGPGRERPGAPGWTTTSPPLPQDPEATNLSLIQVLECLEKLLNEVEPDSQVRSVLCKMMTRIDNRR
jgi:hypothetical protein